MKKNILAFALASLCAVVALVTPAAAQENRLALKPDGTIDSQKFLPANGVHVTLPAIAVSGLATGTTQGFTIPKGALGDPTYPGGLPVQGTTAVLHFYVTSVQVEYVTLTGATGAAVINVGSTGTSTSSVAASASLSYTATAGSVLPVTVATSGTLKPLASGDVITINVGTAFAGATAASFKVHISGYYQ